MARPRAHLNAAPIVEAVIDFRVLRRDDVTAETFSDLQDQVGAVYGRALPLRSLEARFGLEEGRPIQPQQIEASVGWAYQNDAAIAQFRIDGFTFNRLEPYTTWEEVFGEAGRLWGIYVERARPLEISRLAVRYINRLKVQAPANLQEFLAAPPVLPEPMPQTLREFLTRVVVEDAGRNAAAIVVQALERPIDPALITLLLDIDAYREVSWTPGDARIPGAFEQLRQLKNDIFYASITDRTAEMYE